jgi:DNA-damage-inducible protein J
MSDSAMVHVRTDKELKKEVEKIFSSLGMNTSQAINMFLRQVSLRKGLPFDVKIPNASTLAAIKDIEDGTDLTICKDENELFDSLGI